MRTPLEIIAELKHVTYWSQPNIKFTETMNLLNELETTLTVEIVEEVIEDVIDDVVDEIIADFDQISPQELEDILNEEIVEVVPPKPTKPKATPKPKAKPAPKK
jgi:restriction endonuclease Mrr